MSLTRFCNIFSTTQLFISKDKVIINNFEISIKKRDGTYVFPGEVLVYRQSRLWFHPGLNVVIGRRFLNLVATKEGIVRVSCEKPDLNFKSNEHVKSFYDGKEGLDFYKKYFHVIPNPQHTRFKCIDQI